MLFRTSSRSDSSSSLSTDDEYSQLPRFIDNRKDVLRPASQPLSTRRQSRHRRHQVALYFLGLLLIIGLVFRSSLAVAWRDFGYIIRPLWGTPDEGSVPWTRIPHYSDPHPDNSDKRAWCALHGWEARGAPGVLVDSLQITSELDLLEIRIREYAGLVSTMIVFESTMTHAGTPREIQIELQMERFERLAREAGIRLLYQTVGEEFEPNLPKGSFENESRQRIAIGDLIREELRLGGIPDGAVILISDTDEILSRETLELISACHIPDNVHFNLKNYRYAFNLLLPDVGKWGPKAVTIRKDVAFGYSRERTTDAPLLENAGWHCTFCLPTLEDMRTKMRTYSHNDRLTSATLLDEKHLRRRVCTGQDPFGMWPEVFSFTDLVVQSADITPRLSFQHLPLALKQDPRQFPYLVDKGCERPNKAT